MVTASIREMTLARLTRRLTLGANKIRASLFLRHGLDWTNEFTKESTSGHVSLPRWWNKLTLQTAGRNALNKVSLCKNEYDNWWQNSDRSACKYDIGLIGERVT